MFWFITLDSDETLVLWRGSAEPDLRGGRFYGNDNCKARYQVCNKGIFYEEQGICPLKKGECWRFRGELIAGN